MVEITTIAVPFIPGFIVNCYLVKVESGFMLVDTGPTNRRKILDKELAQHGCQPGMLKLIVLTHGDFDHSGNAAYFRERFAAKIAMHVDDQGMVEHGDMQWNRTPPGPIISAIMKLLVRLKKADRFIPDITVREGDDLSAHGFDLTVVELPGHSKGSIGLLTANGDLICGDLLANIKQPESWIIDNQMAADASIEKLAGMTIDTVYPGHGAPFLMETFLQNR